MSSNTDNKLGHCVNSQSPTLCPQQELEDMISVWGGPEALPFHVLHCLISTMPEVRTESTKNKKSLNKSYLKFEQWQVARMHLLAFQHECLLPIEIKDTSADWWATEENPRHMQGSAWTLSWQDEDQWRDRQSLPWMPLIWRHTCRCNQVQLLMLLEGLSMCSGTPCTFHSSRGACAWIVWKASLQHALDFHLPEDWAMICFLVNASLAGRNSWNSTYSLGFSPAFFAATLGLRVSSSMFCSLINCR